MVLLNMMDGFNESIGNRAISIYTVSTGSSPSLGCKSIILIPTIFTGAAIVYVLIYNTLDLGGIGKVYLSIDADLFIRIGKHKTRGAINSPYFVLEGRLNSFYNKLMEEIDTLFNRRAKLYPWLRYIPDVDKHNVLC